MPGTPTRVTSSGWHSARVRSSAPARSSSSRVRPTNGELCGRSAPMAPRAVVGLPYSQGLGLPLGLDRRRFGVLDRSNCRLERLRRDEDAVDRRGRLQASCGVHDVTGRQRLTGFRSGVESDQRFAGGDPDAKLDAFRFGVVSDGERSPYSALRVVLVGDGRSEERHHRVPDELLDRAAVALELLLQPRVVRPRSAATSSGSISSALLVKPTRSQKRTVRTLRSWRVTRSDPVGTAAGRSGRREP